VGFLCLPLPFAPGPELRWIVYYLEVRATNSLTFPAMISST